MKLKQKRNLISKLIPKNKKIKERIKSKEKKIRKMILE